MTDTASITSIPLNKLNAWDGNVRKTAGADTALAELAASIAAHGLLQSLVVRKAKRGAYAVVAGGRRLAALQLLAEEGKIADDKLIECNLVADDADATEISLAENTVREQMHPADEFEAFRVLIAKGTPVDDIAARFGVTPRVVEQRMKLASVSPLVIEAFRKGELNLAQVMAFAASDDHAAQEQVFDQLTDYNGDPDDIRSTLTEDEIAATDRRVKFVTLKAYEKAGGGVRRDLFAQDDDGVFILDPVLLDSLVTNKLQKTAKQIAKEGWKWVDVCPSFSWHNWKHCERCYPEPLPLTAELQEELDVLNREYEALCDTDRDLTEKQSARADEITARCDEIEDREKIWQPETLAIAGAVVSIGHDGKASIERGFILSADKPKKKPQTRTVEKLNDDGTVETVEVAETFTLSRPLIESLTTHRSAIISAALIDNPDVALASIVYTLALQIINHGNSRNTALQISASESFLQNVEESTAFEVIERARTNWGDQLPGDPDALWSWCLEQDRATLIDLLTFCVARTVNAVLAMNNRPDDERFTHVDQLVKVLDIDMATWFKPTAENYFGKISKSGIIEALKEAKNGTVAPAWLKAKKADLAAIAEREIADTGWLPTPLKCAA